MVQYLDGSNKGKSFPSLIVLASKQADGTGNDCISSFFEYLLRN